MQTFKKILLSNQAVLSILLLIILAIIILLLPALLPDNIGRIDFRPYWSSSYLLARGQDFSDSSNMDYVERTLTGWRGSFTMHAWFAPIGNLILLPFTLIPFAHASYFWLLTNITVVFVSLFLLWRDTRKSIWIPIVAAFGFSITLVSFIYGQVNTLVVLGLALFLYFSKSGLEYAAGASLGLTTIKPHLVILTLPILLVDVIWRKQWRIVAGFVGVLIGCSLILFILYPAWPTSFWRLITSGMEAVRETPTINGLLVVTRGIHGGNGSG